MREDLIPKVTIPEGQRGRWRIDKFTIPEPPNLQRMRLIMDGRDPGHGEFTRMLRDGDVVMSDTDAERRDHIEFVLEAKGHVLINGLGLGVAVGAAQRRPQVEKITVIEIDEDVIELVGPHYPDAEIIHADAFEYQPPKGVRYGAVWHDIWTAPAWDETLPEMARLHRKYGRRCDWQGSWLRDELLRLRREDRERERLYAAFRAAFR